MVAPVDERFEREIEDTREKADHPATGESTAITLNVRIGSSPSAALGTFSRSSGVKVSVSRNEQANLRRNLDRENPGAIIRQAPMQAEQHEGAERRLGASACGPRRPRR